MTVLELWPPAIESRWRITVSGPPDSHPPGWQTIARLQCRASWTGTNRNFCEIGRRPSQLCQRRREEEERGMGRGSVPGARRSASL